MTYYMFVKNEKLWKTYQVFFLFLYKIRNMYLLIKREWSNVISSMLLKNFTYARARI